MTAPQKTSSTLGNEIRQSSHSTSSSLVSEEEYARGHYLPTSVLHDILENLHKLKLKIKTDDGKKQDLVFKKRRHPNDLHLLDSDLARQNLQSLVSLSDYLSQIQPMPEDMCDVDDFELEMKLDDKSSWPVVKQALLKGLTYTDKDGVKKTLAQFYVMNSEDNPREDAFYGVCVPRTAQGRKALLKLLGFTIYTQDASRIAPQGEYRRYKEHMLNAGGIFGEYNDVRRHLYWKLDKACMLRDNPFLCQEDLWKIQSHRFGSASHVRCIHYQRMRDGKKVLVRYTPPTDKDALYIVDPNGDFIVTKKALVGEHRFYDRWRNRRVSPQKSQAQIMKFTHALVTKDRT